MKYCRVDYARQFLGISMPKLRYMIRHGYIKSSKIPKSVKNQRKVRVFSMDELKRVKKLLQEST